MEKIIQINPAFDKRNPDPSKNYGIHGVDMRFILKGDKGAVQFVLYTNWHLSHVQEELTNKCNSREYCFLKPMPADLGYHSLKPIYEGQEPMSDSCEYLDGKPCYYDGSGLSAIKIYDILVKEGDKGLWRELEEFYNDIFKEDM